MMEGKWKRVVAAHGVLVRGEDVLLVSNCWDGKNCFWTLPGGGPEANESLREAVVREFHEETNLSVRVGRLLWVTDALIQATRQHFQFYSFEIVHAEGDMGIPTGESLVRAVEFRCALELDALIYWADLREPLGNYLRQPDECLRLYVYNYEQVP